MKKIIAILIPLCFLFMNAKATHNRAGEITYNHISCNTFGITVTTYTNTNPATTQVNRCELTALIWKAGILIDSIVLPRVNGISSICTYPDHDGQDVNILSGTVSLYPFTSKNTYYYFYTFPESGTYQITMDDPNRNAGTCNINNGNSVNTSFSLISELVINPVWGYNNSSVLLSLPLDQTCVGNCFTHNPAAYDADGDSLSYSLVPCADNHGALTAGWVFPPNMTWQSIDSIRGDLKWCSPNQICNYNIAIKIKEYRLSGVTKQWNYMGYIIRDMQISVQSCANTPPQINTVNDTTIAAGVNLQLNISATDAQTNIVTLIADGGPFHITPTATFTSTPSNSPVNGTFSWTPNCAQVREQPYSVTFKASDSDPTTPLSTYKSMFIHVISAPTDITGNVTYSGGNVTNGNAVLYYLNSPFTNYDTAQMVQLNASGNYDFINVLQGQYLVKIFPNISAYPTLVSSYSGSKNLWDSALVINHTCLTNNVVNISMNEKPTITGNGVLSGYVYDGVGFLGHPGNVISGVDMKLADNATGNIIASTFTNSSGFYSFNTIPSNTYIIYADIPGLNFGTPYIRTINSGNLTFTQLNYYVNCSSITLTNPVNVPVTNDIDNDFAIYPNPANEYISISTLGVSDFKNIIITVYDNTGRLIIKEKITDSKTELNIAKLQSGLYFLQLQNGEKIFNRKFIKE